jgi:hypothetical protein
MPNDVAERIDGVIAGLAAERVAASLPPGGVHRSDPEAPAVVVPLDPAALRRRRRVRLLFGAAAAAAVVAVGVSVVSDSGAGDDLTTAHQLAQDDSARESAVAGTHDEDAGGVAQEAPEAAESPSAVSSGGADQGYVAPQRVPTEEPVRDVRADRLREDLVALQHVTLPHPTTADYDGATLSAPTDFICEPASFGRGYLVGVIYDGKPAVVAFRRPVGSTQEAEVLTCGTGDVIHSTTLTATG